MVAAVVLSVGSLLAGCPQLDPVVGKNLERLGRECAVHPTSGVDTIDRSSRAGGEDERALK
jgi:hypothetical protein